MKRILIISLILLPFAAFSQQYINKTKAEVRKGLDKYILANDTIKATLTETDSSLVLKVTGTKTLPADFIYGFDKAGKCNSQKTIAYCDSCLNKFLQLALDEKKYQWKKINENQYISAFNDKMMIEISAVDKNYFSLILRTDWSKLLYDMLIEK